MIHRAKPELFEVGVLTRYTFVSDDSYHR